MSFTQKEIIKQILEWQSKKEDEVRELKKMTNYFLENDRTKKAREVAFSDELSELRNQFSSFFSTHSKGEQ